MSEPLGLQEIFVSTMAGAGFVLAGALYALFFALSRIHGGRALQFASGLSFLLLIVAVLLLADALSLSGFWSFVALVMLLGYYVLPRTIWHLCVGTHADEPNSVQTRATR